MPSRSQPKAGGELALREQVPHDGFDGQSVLKEAVGLCITCQ